MMPAGLANCLICLEQMTSSGIEAKPYQS